MTDHHTSTPNHGARPPRTWSPRRSPSSPRAAARRPSRRRRLAARPSGRLDVPLHGRALPARPLGGRPASIARTVDGEPADVDAQDFVVELRDALGIPDELLPTYLEEIASTLASARVEAHAPPDADRRRPGRRRLPDDRGGDDRGPPGLRRQQRPDRLRRRRLRRATRRRRAGRPAACGSPCPREAHLAPRPMASDERPLRGRARRATLARFAARLRELGLDPADYLYLPGAPVAVAQQARGHVRPRRRRARTSCCSARATDAHRAAAVDPHVLQHRAARSGTTSRPRCRSRTWASCAACRRPTWRRRRRSTTGSPTSSTATRRCAECGFAVLRELAAIGWTGDAYHRLAGPSPYREDARRAVAGEPGAAARPRASGWRRWRRCCTATATARSLVGRADPRLRAAPPASGCAPTCDAYLRPLVHCLLRLRPGVHAARREPDPGAARPRAGADAS